VSGTTLFYFPYRLGLICVFFLLAGSAIVITTPKPEYLARFTPFLIAVWLVAMFSHDRKVYDVVEMALFPFLVIALGFGSFNIKIPSLMGDISYGLYIYHFVVAEIVRSWQTAWIGVRLQILLSLILSAIAAWLSFHLVEKRALSFKKSQSSAAAPASTNPSQPSGA
jgi:peptidoglycan/LPS O-acetylase OafA/YrhL